MHAALLPLRYLPLRYPPLYLRYLSPTSPLSLPYRFMLLCSTFGILDMLVNIRPLQLILNLYIALLAGWR